MIYAHDAGRMCNNILQFGHVYAWAQENGRKCVSLRFAYKYHHFHICHTRGHTVWTYLAVKLLWRLGLIRVVRFYETRPDHDEKERQMKSRRNVVVTGWHIRYYDLFIKHLPTIRALFAFSPQVDKECEPIIPGGDGDGTIWLGVHVRRSDYRTFQGGAFYYDDEVYIGLIGQFALLHPGKRINALIASNEHIDIDHWRERLPETRIAYYPRLGAIHDLCLLSRCHFLIGAPSTFSLVASMYRNIPLYWIYERGKTLGMTDFKRFEELFRTLPGEDARRPDEKAPPVSH